MQSNLDEESVRALADASQRLATVRPDPPRRRSIVGSVFVWLGLIAQLISIVFLVQLHGMGTDHGGTATMAVMGFALCAWVVILPGTLVALVRAISEAARLVRKEQPAPRWLIFYGVVTLMPLVLFGAVIWDA